MQVACRSGTERVVGNTLLGSVGNAETATIHGSLVADEPIRPAREERDANPVLALPFPLVGVVLAAARRDPRDPIGRHYTAAPRSRLAPDPRRPLY